MYQDVLFFLFGKSLVEVEHRMSYITVARKQFSRGRDTSGKILKEPFAMVHSIGGYCIYKNKLFFGVGWGSSKKIQVPCVTVPIAAMKRNILGIF